jgi:hypothetical protein
LDDVFNSYFSSSKHVWISGNSGIGKTNLVIRNLRINQKPFVFIDLSTLHKKGIPEIFDYINNEITEQCEIQTCETKKDSIEKITSNLFTVLEKYTELILFIDEVPISDKEKFQEFANNFITISDLFFNKASTSLTFKWIISTRINPTLHFVKDDSCLSNFKKASKNFNFKNLDPWNASDLSRLLSLLELALNFCVDENIEQKIIDVANGFPGKLKDIIERMIIEDCSIGQAIEMIKNEA